jgi:N-acetylmuramoyl-L-alanine amidase
MSKFYPSLNAGHGKSTDGSWDSGCVYGKYTEANLMLPITKYMVSYLRGSGVKILTDADNGNKRNMIADVTLANKEGCNIYVSIHCDYSQAPKGTMPLYVSESGRKLAVALNKAVMKDMDMKTRGVCKRTDLYELNASNGVACIFETGSIKADLKKLKKSKAYGKALAKGLCKYMGVKFTGKMK